MPNTDPVANVATKNQFMPGTSRSMRMQTTVAPAPMMPPPNDTLSSRSGSLTATRKC